MKIKLFTLFPFFLLFPILLLAQSENWIEKIDPVVLADLQASGRAEVVVVMQQQADLAKAGNLATRLEKGNFVYEKLYQAAVHSQQRVQELLDAEEHPYLSFYLVNALALTADQPLLRKLAELPEVAEIIEDQTFVLDLAPQSAGPVQSRGVEWGIANIMADSVWSAYGITGTGVVVGGQDTGYDWDHPALVNQYRGYSPGNTNHNYNWHDAIHSAGSGNPCGSNSSIPCDDHSHGTHTMGTMVGDDGAGNQIGVAPGAKWIGCRNMDEGVGSLSTYLECFEWFLAPYPVGGAPSQGDPSKAPHVINNSWGCPTYEGCNSSNWGTLETAITNLLAAGVMVVASAGNRGLFGCESVEHPPAIFAGSFTVGATQSNDFIANFSSRGPTPDGGLMKPDICAPGVGIRSCVPGTGYDNKNGTSMAGPHVVGLVALLLEADPGLSIGSLQSVIETTARPKTSSQVCGGVPGSQIPNNTYGHGIINAAAAVEDVLGILPVEWLQFEGRHTASGVELSWQTLTEQNNAHFDILSSAEGEQWEMIGEVPGQGNSQGLQSYHFLDPSPFSPWSYYRLRQVDEDGSYTYSRTIAVQAPEGQLRITFFPNPSTGTFQYRWYGAEDEAARLEIFDLRGRRIRQLKLSQRSGILEIEGEGLYIFRLSQASRGQTLSGKLMVAP